MSSGSVEQSSEVVEDASCTLDNAISGVKRSLEIAISGSVSGSGGALDVQEEFDTKTKPPPTSRPRQQLQVGCKGYCIFYLQVILKRAVVSNFENLCMFSIMMEITS